MTIQLVFANITIVMTRTNSDLTRKKLIEAGTEEFYRKGYRQASLRKICADCGVTTGAFYFLFPGKDALLAAIVDPVVERCMALTEELFQKEMADPSYGPESDHILTRFQYHHRREFLILMEKCGGSSREHVRELFLNRISSYFNQFFTQALGAPPDPDLMRILVSLRVQGILEILKGDYTLEETLALSSAISHYADGGAGSLINFIKRMSKGQPSPRG